jgi:hypothetical protein
VKKHRIPSAIRFIDSPLGCLPEIVVPAVPVNVAMFASGGVRRNCQKCQKYELRGDFVKTQTSPLVLVSKKRVSGLSGVSGHNASVLLQMGVVRCGNRRVTLSL